MTVPTTAQPLDVLPAFPAVLRAWAPGKDDLEGLMRFEFGWDIASLDLQPADLGATWAVVGRLTNAGDLGMCSSVSASQRWVRCYCRRWEGEKLLAVLRRAGIAEQVTQVVWTEHGRPVGEVVAVSRAGSALFASVTPRPLDPPTEGAA